MIGRWLSLLMARAIARAAVRLAVWLSVAVLAAAVAPVSAVAVGAYAVAARRALQPRQLLIAAAWCAPMVAVWLAWTAAAAAGWHAVAAAPYHAWLAWWRLAIAGHLLRAVATTLPPAIPLGLLAGALAWSVPPGIARRWHRRPVPRLGRRVRSAAVAEPGTVGQGQDRRARLGAADDAG